MQIGYSANTYYSREKYDPAKQKRLENCTLEELERMRIRNSYKVACLEKQIERTDYTEFDKVMELLEEAFSDGTAIALQIFARKTGERNRG